MSKSTRYIIGAIALVSLTRLLPHPPNFTALGGMALFAGALLQAKSLRYVLPLALLFVTDILLNNFIYGSQFDGFTLFYPGAIFTYVALAAIVVLGSSLIKRLSVGRVALGSLGASALFFIISNFGVWASSGMYPLSAEGLMACYAAALPFLDTTILGDLTYSTLLFGSYYFLFEREMRVSEIR